jgi:hypothetical protein
MNRSVRVIVAVLALLLLVAGTAFAVRSPIADQHRSPVAASHEPGTPEADASESPEAGASPKADAPDASGAPLTDGHAQQILDLLKAAGIDTGGITTADLQALAATYGVGGAVRLEAWASASGKTVDEIAAMFDSGMGWGQIAKSLEQADPSLNLSPGIGWIMGNGHGHANGQAKGASRTHGNPHTT